jgi:hypothetical protein
MGSFQSASVRICHELGLPIAEVLLVRGQGGTWVGVIDGRLVKGPRIGLWVRVRQGGSYRGVLGSVDDPLWISVGEQVLDVSPSARRGGPGLSALAKANKRPRFGFADYSPAVTLPRSFDRAGDRFRRRRHDGRVVMIRRGRPSDRAEQLRLDLLDMVDPYDGSVIDVVSLEPGYAVSDSLFGLDLWRRPDLGLSGRLSAGSPGRVLASSSYRWGRHTLSADALNDALPAGYELGLDHSSGLPSEHGNRLIDDRGRGLTLSSLSKLGRGLSVATGFVHRADAGYMGLWDSLAHGEWRQRNALLFALQRQADAKADTQAKLDLNFGFWQTDDQREIAGSGLTLGDADGDGQLEEFPNGVLFTSDHQLWVGRLDLELTQKMFGLRGGVRFVADAAGMSAGSVQVNRGDSGVALGQIRSHPLLGDRPSFVDGFGSAEVLVQAERAPWLLRGQFGAVAAPQNDRSWTGTLALSRRLAGSVSALTLWSRPQRRLLDRHLAVEGYLAQGLSDSMPYGRSVIGDEERLIAPFTEGLRYDGESVTSRSAGVWRYAWSLGLEELAHSADGVDRSGQASPYADDGSLRSWWLSGRMDFAAFSGMRFHGSVWFGQSFAQRIRKRGLQEPELDADWTPLSEVPVWRWRNSITQVVAAQWMTGGGLEATSPMSNSERSALSTLHTFQIPSQVRIDAWMRYQRQQLAVTLSADNAMAPFLLAPLPRPDRVPGLLPVTPRRIMLSLEWRPQGRSGRAEAFP